MIRVVVAEDSPTVRELLVSILESDPEISVVGQARDGFEAVELATRLRPHLITMDINMPGMDGLAATQEIMVHAPTSILIASSLVTGQNVELSLRATQAGALMVMRTPSDPLAPDFAEQRAQLLAMVKAMAHVKVVRRWAPRARSARTAPPPRRRTGSRPSLVAMAASTGGPAALQRILSELPASFSAPILVVQHIATGFVSGLARWLDQGTHLSVRVAEQGETIRNGCVYLAPDNLHIGVDHQGRVALSDADPRGGFRPSANHLFESVARVYRDAAVAVILTGMGRDGVEGLTEIRAAGGHVIAQDEASCVVYGMPQEAVRAGVVDAVLSVQEIPGHLSAQFARGEADV